HRPPPGSLRSTDHRKRPVLWGTHTALRLATCDIGHILLVLHSRYHTALAFDASAILRRQGGLDIIDPLPWCKGRFARGTRHKFGWLNLFIAMHIPRTIPENFSHHHADDQLRLRVLFQQWVVVINGGDPLYAQPVWLLEIDEQHTHLAISQ